MNRLPALTILSIFLAALVFACLTGCSPPTMCDLYPGGNSHAGPRCLNCHKHWNGKWYQNDFGKHITEEEKLCEY